MEPKILLLDIETLPNLVYAWSLKVPGEYINHDALVEERTLLCAAWKWLGKPEIYSKAAVPTGSDRATVAALHRVLSGADAVVTHNGDRFDLGWIRARAIFHGMKPLPEIISIDTKKIAKKHFYFNSNRLDYLGRYLGLGAKIHTDFDLWLRCMKHEPGAMEEMLKYNKQDVRLLEKVYLKLRPFTASKLNRALDGGGVCPSCGADALVRRGFSRTRSRLWQRFQCSDCGHWSQKPLAKNGVIR